MSLLGEAIRCPLASMHDELRCDDLGMYREPHLIKGFISLTTNVIWNRLQLCYASSEHGTQACNLFRNAPGILTYQGPTSRYHRWTLISGLQKATSIGIPRNDRELGKGSRGIKWVWFDWRLGLGQWSNSAPFQADTIHITNGHRRPTEYAVICPGGRFCVRWKPVKIDASLQRPIASS